ncbi:ABC transporter permease [Roseibium aggregatum]|uniref:ABC transporter permease n=1 Tax=Roseibium aggregatum TaxID=187304 RepID=A0A939J350_9HYPH|nr:ABC transporter permease [Roseibium aggregatum]MBN9673871.1 ABC transporter permease [Roseibium aggregatum]
MKFGGRLKYVSQEKIVFTITLVMFAVFAVSLDGFIGTSNLLALLRSVAVLGILGLGMLIVVLGRGIDLSMVANMAISVAWTIQLVGTGMPLWAALAIGLGFALGMSLITGILVAFAEIPAIFATLAMGTFIYGFGRAHLITGTDVVYLPADFGWAAQIGQGRLLGVPIPILLAVILAVVVYLFLRFSKHGWNTYNIGDNAQASRITGIAVRPTMVLQYMLSGTAAYLAGLITATAVQSMNTRIVNSNMIYDVILIVVLGGVSLSGGRGSVRNVIVGTLLIGVLVNGMTIMDIQYTIQNVIKSLILLLAIVADSVINPRDEQTGQQGDI